MRRPTITAALVAVGFVAAAFSPIYAQTQPGTVVVPAPAAPAPAPSASPPTTITHGLGGTTVTVPPGSTVTVTPPAPAVAIAAKPWCAGGWAAMGGTNFGGCPGNIPR